jgi:hypothetical protein
MTGSQPFCRIFGSHRTRRWRELDSNLRFRARAGSILPVRFVADSLLEEDRFELAVPPRRERLWAATPGKHCRFGPELVSDCAFGAAVSDWQRPEEPFAGAGPMVRIRFPPAASQRRAPFGTVPPESAGGSAMRGSDPQGAVLQLIGEPPDDQIATEAHRRSGVMQCPPGTPLQTGCLRGVRLRAPL